MSAYTPGPWVWSNVYKTGEENPTWALVSTTDNYGILACDGIENSPQGLIDFENAQLIASSPDLLEALQQIDSGSCERSTEGYGACRKQGCTPDAPYLADKMCNSCIAHEAIQKATGGGL